MNPGDALPTGNDEERDILLEEYHARRLDAAGRARLAQTLTQDDAARATALAEVRTALALDSLLRPQATEAVVARVAYVLERSRPGPARAMIGAVQRRIARRRRQRRATAWLAIGAAAGVALVAVTWVSVGVPGHAGGDAPTLLPAEPPLPAALSATVTGTSTLARAGVETPLADGAALQAGDRIRLQPPALVALRWLADGTRLVVARAGDLTVEAVGDATHGKRLRLREGECEATVARQPPGAPLVITTPQGQATVVGTRFTVAVDASATHLQVDEGVVRLEGAQGRDALAVAAGERASVDAAGIHRPVASQVPPLTPGAWETLAPVSDTWHVDRGAWHREGDLAVLDGHGPRGARLESARSFGDFEFRCRVRAPAGKTWSELQIRGYSAYAVIHAGVVDPRWHELQVRAQGERCEVTIDGVPQQVLPTGRAHLHAGSIAFFVGRDHALEIADMRVRTLPPR